MTHCFIIVGTATNGGSAFANALARHPDVFVGREWMLNIPVWRKMAIAKQVTGLNFENLVEAHHKHIEAAYRQPKFIGFQWLFRSTAKWMIHPRLAPALMLDRLENFLDWARRDNHLRVIHIVGNDHMGWLWSKDWINSRLKSLADTGRYFRARFEDFAVNNDRTAQGALAFLGCDLESLPNLEAKIRRQSRAADSGDGILYYEQLQAALSACGLLMSSF